MGKRKTKDNEILADYKFFAERTLHWTISFSVLFANEENELTKSERYESAVKKTAQAISEYLIFFAVC